MTKHDQTQLALGANHKTEQKDAIATKMSDAHSTQIAMIEQVIGECGLSAICNDSSIMQGFKMARGIKLLRELITDEMMNDIMTLRGSVLGFLTDRDKQTEKPQYDVATVKDCFIVASMRGARSVGNEWNILAGNCYMTLPFFRRMLGDFPGLSDLKEMPGVPAANRNGDGALVPISVTWKLNGMQHRLDRQAIPLADGKFMDERIPIRVNKGMGADAILGKAARKILAAVYNRITGSEITEGDVSDLHPGGYPGAPEAAPSGDDLDALAGELETKQTTAEQSIGSAGPTVGAQPTAGAGGAAETNKETNPEPSTTVAPEMPEQELFDNLQVMLGECETPARVEDVRKWGLARAQSEPVVKTVNVWCMERLIDFQREKAAAAAAEKKGRK